MRALVISGGGSKGAYAGGVAQYLIQEEGRKYDMFLGTSTGSLLVPHIAAGKIDKIHEVGFSFDLIILNAGGYTHTSVSLADAIASISTPVIEVHISNVFAREDFRHVSLIAPKCKGSIKYLCTMQEQVTTRCSPMSSRETKLNAELITCRVCPMIKTKD